MEVFNHVHVSGENHLLKYKGINVAFQFTEWLDGGLYLSMNGQTVACLNEDSEVLTLFIDNEYVIENSLA